MPKGKKRVLKAPKYSEQVEKVEEELSFEDDTAELPPSDVVAYNEQRSCADLFRMVEKQVLEIRPDYQRGVVWTDSDKTRFIDSLTKQLPIPSLCFSYDHKQQKWQVIDGLQRMTSLVKFLGEDTWRLSKLKDIDQKLRGQKVSEIRRLHPDIYSRVENMSLPVTVLRCDFSKSKHMEYIFTIFHRLNAGGVRLNNQEIRNAIFQGSYNSFLLECDGNKDWRSMFHKDGLPLGRMRGVELVLRLFAFSSEEKEYTGQLASFLNAHMQLNRDIAEVEIEEKRILFGSVVNLIKNNILQTGEVLRVPNAVIDAVLYGVAQNLSQLSGAKAGEAKKFYKKLIDDPLFTDAGIREGTMKTEKVSARLKRAKDIFAGRK